MNRGKCTVRDYPLLTPGTGTPRVSDLFALFEYLFINVMLHRSRYSLYLYVSQYPRIYWFRSQFHCGLEQENTTKMVDGPLSFTMILHRPRYKTL